MLSFVPTPFTAVIMTTAMPAAIRAYSMEVAPVSSLRNARNPLNIGSSIGKTFTERTEYQLVALERRITSLPDYECATDTSSDHDSASKTPGTQPSLRPLGNAADDEEHEARMNDRMAVGAFRWDLVVAACCPSVARGAFLVPPQPDGTHLRILPDMCCVRLLRQTHLSYAY